jgi:hypothetical protein
VLIYDWTKNGQVSLNTFPAELILYLLGDDGYRYGVIDDSHR